MNQRKLAVAVTMALGLSAFGGGAFAQSIANTKHNLGSNDTTQNRVTSGTDEICVFCHTPHGSDTDAVVPLWNKNLPTPASYQTYADLGTSTLDAATANVGSVSIACLSCHDGTQAMDNIINAPGSGGYDSTGGGANGLDYTWAAGSSASGTLDTTTGKLSGGITLIGEDLRNDHPIGIQYGGGPVTTLGSIGTDYGDSNADFRDSDFNPIVSNGDATAPYWWVDTEASGNGTRNKTDMILYTRNPASGDLDNSSQALGVTGSQPFVECASCHDPHTENTTFLRIDNSGSAVCLACHDK